METSHLLRPSYKITHFNFLEIFLNLHLILLENNFLCFTVTFETFLVRKKSASSELGFQQNIFVSGQILIDCISTKLNLVSIVRNLVHSPTKLSNDKPMSYVYNGFIKFRIGQCFLEIRNSLTKMSIILRKSNIVVEVDFLPFLRVYEIL